MFIVIGTVIYCIMEKCVCLYYIYFVQEILSNKCKTATEKLQQYIWNQHSKYLNEPGIMSWISSYSQ